MNFKAGDIIEIPLWKLKPTQPDDGKFPHGSADLEIIVDRGAFLIQHGNHRYYRSMENTGPNELVRAKVVPNPYIEY